MGVTMNKGFRNRIKQLKYKKRIKNLFRGYGWSDTVANDNCYKTTGKPCSCAICSPTEEKKKYKIKHKGKFTDE